jgi:peptide chain release factor 2
MEKLKKKLYQFRNRFETLVSKLSLREKEAEIARLEKIMARPKFWENRAEAQSTIERLTNLTQEVKAVGGLRKRLFETLTQLEVFEREKTEVLDLKERVKGLTAEINKIGKEIDALELNLFFNASYDRSNAVIAIHAGQGGIEAMDWASMLLRMYTRFAKAKGFTVRFVDEARGEETGIKSATLIEGKFAYGYLKGEAGVHRLVRLSPFDADHARHTSFALVEILPQIEKVTEVEINPEDLELEAFRASGHGGQYVNKTSTAVRIRHRPTGITVTCQAERSQHQNREIAKKILSAKLWQISQEKLAEKKRKLRGEYKEASWGNQIRSYVLHPYRLVKDLRTGFETSNTQAVLDGDLDDFVKAWLRKGLEYASIKKGGQK